ncbi:hypothetical protein ACVJBD_007457 [Rhizobium mongolense]
MNASDYLKRSAVYRKLVYGPYREFARVYAAKMSNEGFGRQCTWRSLSLFRDLTDWHVGNGHDPQIRFPFLISSRGTARTRFQLPVHAIDERQKLGMDELDPVVADAGPAELLFLNSTDRSPGHHNKEVSNGRHAFPERRRPRRPVGFWGNTSCASAAKPSTPFRMSVIPQARYTRTPVPGPTPLSKRRLRPQFNRNSIIPATPPSASPRTGSSCNAGISTETKATFRD